MTIKQTIKQFSYGILILLSLLLIACGPSEDSELRHYMNEIKSRRSKPIEPIPQFEPPVEFSYPEVEKRRSPFKPIVPDTADTLPDQLAPTLNRPKQPLEAFALDSLKFVGVLKEKSTIWGLISQPEGSIARVKRGDYMGKNYGQVIRIKDDVIEIEESVQVNGRWEKKTVTLKLISAKQ